MFVWFVSKIICPKDKDGFIDSTICSEFLSNKLEKKYSDLTKENYYLRIIHQKNNHVICVGLCEKNGEIDNFTQAIEYPKLNKKYDVLLEHKVSLLITDKQNKKTPLQNTITKLGHNIKSETVSGTKFKKYSKINEINESDIKNLLK